MTVAKLSDLDGKSARELVFVQCVTPDVGTAHGGHVRDSIGGGFQLVVVEAYRSGLHEVGDAVLRQREAGLSQNKYDDSRHDKV